MSETVLITGASGRVGRHAARAFAGAGWQVRTFQRGADLTADLVRDAQGVDVIVNGMNPPNYHNWAQLIPEITQAHIAAAKASGATVIIPGNVYAFGAQPGPWSDQTPPAPNSRKGKIRQEMERAYRAAAMRTIVLRAGNFIDVDAPGDAMQQMHLRALSTGKITTPGDPNVMQSWCYLPDWAQAAQALAAKRGELARFEDIAFEGHGFSVAEMKDRLERITGRDLRMVRFPWWIMRLASPVWELARELNEMRYLWDLDHRLDGTKLRRLLPEFQPTDLDVILRAAVDQALIKHRRQPEVALRTLKG